jgi:staphylococcal nuclease domain-containing protein 1
VEAGLARLHTRSAERLSHYTALAAAETNAKDNRVGVWKDYDPEEEARKEREAREARDKALSERNEASKIKITVTDIVDGGNFWFQTVGSQTEALEELMGAFQSVDFDSQDAYTPKKGEIVAGKFSIDDNWYRAEVQKITGDDIQLIFVDYGNVETVKASAVRALPEDFSLTILPKQASHGRLALIRVPGLESDYGVDAAAFLKELVWDKELVATVQYKEDNVSYLSVGDPDTKVPINASLVMNGLARVQRSRSRSAFYDLLVEEQEKAKKNRVNMWQYGDIDSE